MKWVTPTYLIVVFVGFCWQSLPGYLSGLQGNDVARWTVLFIVAIAVGLLILTRVGAGRWRAAGLDLDGRHPPQD